MAIQSVAPSSNVIPFPTAPAANARRARLFRTIIGAPSLADIRLQPGDSDDDEVLCLIASRIGFEARRRYEQGDATPRMLSITAGGGLELAEVVPGLALQPGASYVTAVTGGIDDSALAYRLGATLDDHDWAEPEDEAR